MSKGFTLIELLVAVFIIAVLASVALAKYADSRTRTYVASMRNDLRNLGGAQEVKFDRLDNNLGVFLFTGDDGLLEEDSRDAADAILAIADWHLPGKLSSAQLISIRDLYDELEFRASDDVTIVVQPTFVVTPTGLHLAKGYIATARHSRAGRWECRLQVNSAVELDGDGIARKATLAEEDQYVHCDQP
jgi:prepilin-type N-terminal cleavage/methylation domain-containing protein